MTSFWRRVLAPTAVLLLLSSTSTLAAPALNKEQIFQLATLAAKDGEFDRSVELFQKVIELDPDFVPAYNSLGLLYQDPEQGDINEAIRYFRIASDLAPQQVEGWNNLGRAYYTNGRFVDAEKAFLRSLQIKPGQDDINFVLAWDYLLGQSRPEEALRSFNIVLPTPVGQANPMIHYGMGLAYMIQGDRFKVLDAVTQLRRHQKEPEAARLEAMVRDNVRLSSKPGTPLVTGNAPEESLFDKQLKALGADANASGKENIKVRLKGPLL